MFNHYFKSLSLIIFNSLNLVIRINHYFESLNLTIMFNHYFKLLNLIIMFNHYFSHYI